MDQVNYTNWDLWTLEFNRVVNNLSIKLPTKYDLDGAVEAILRLQETYNLPTNDTAKGLIHGVLARKPMSAMDCYRVGRAAFDGRQDSYASQWLEKSLELHPNYEMPWITDAMFMLGKIYKRVEWHIVLLLGWRAKGT